MTKEKKLKCEVCQKEIPHSVAHTAEGADYIHHFCSPECQDHYFREHPELKKGKKEK